ncbi:MAG: PAS domain S-box protein [Usitatibacter sp.]
MLKQLEAAADRAVALTAHEVQVLHGENFQMLLDGVQDHAIFMLDPQGRVVSWNAGAEKIKGYSATEVIGRNFSVFFPAEEIALGRPREVLRLTEANGRHEEQTIRVRRDGTRFPAHVTLTALRDSSGCLKGFAEFSHDMSESSRSEARFRAMMEAAPDAMVVVDARGTIVVLNLRAEKQFGYKRDELIGQQVTQIIPHGFTERLIAGDDATASEVLEQCMGAGLELMARRKDGSEFPIELMLSPLESAGVKLVTAAIRDISVRKAAEAVLLEKVEELDRSNEELAQFASQAAAANKELEAFAYSVSHDLRAPLRTLDGFSQVLLEDYSDKLDDEGRDSLARIRAASQRMGALIDDMLALSKVTRRPIAMSETNLSAMASEILQDLRHGQPPRRVDFVVAPAMVASTDAHLMRIVLVNLLGNAWKFTSKRAQARIEFGLLHQDGRDVYFVRDDGAGFDPAYASTLFGAFQRMHNADEFEGTGIGLATVQRIIHRLGGQVWADAAIDKGATFYFSLSPAEAP